MKRWLFISGIVTIIILMAVWVYLLFFGVPSKGEVFNAFDFGDTTDQNIPGPTATEEVVVTDNNTFEPLAQLRQLTTKQVIGYTEVAKDASSTPVIYFAEAGTGHVFSLDLTTGVENRISNITIPVASKAAISKNGQYVAIASDSDLQQSGIEILTLATDGSAPSSFAIDEPVIDFKMSTGDDLLYANQTNNSVIGKSLNLKTKVTKTLFEIPFREAVIVWGETADATHYVYPKASSQLEGYFYQIQKGTLSRTPIAGYGLTTIGNGTYSIFTRQENNHYQSYSYDVSKNTAASLVMGFLPEKCAFSKNNAAAAVCAYTFNSDTATLPDTWYQGEISFSDDLWEVSLADSESLLLVDTLAVSGRELDIINLLVSTDDEQVYFINKNDRTLWVYDFQPPDLVQ